jgi:hypothetical protein
LTVLKSSGAQNKIDKENPLEKLKYKLIIMTYGVVTTTLKKPMQNQGGTAGCRMQNEAGTAGCRME